MSHSSGLDAVTGDAGPGRVNPALVALHWLMAGLFALAIGGIVTRGLLPSGHALRPELRTLHIVCGQLVLAFGITRLLVRLFSRMPTTPSAPRWATRAGHAAHMALYAVMLAQPVSGIVFMQAGDKKVAFFGWTLPRLIESNAALQSDVKELHQLVGNAFYGLLTLHISAALWHHFVLKNDTLRRMLQLRRVAPAPVDAHQASAPTESAWTAPGARMAGAADPAKPQRDKSRQRAATEELAE